MHSELFAAMMESPELPELIDRAQRAFAQEQKVRAKFYRDVTPEKKWEFIQGEIVMHSPALHAHTLAVQRLYKLVDAHVETQDCGVVCTENAMTVFPRNDYEPDLMFFGPAKTLLIDPKTLKYPIPDFIVEVLSPSTKKRDRGIKFQDYAAHGVAEYWIVDPVDETVEVHRLVKDRYPPAKRQNSGSISSEVIPGFEIPLRAIFDKAENVAALRKIYAHLS